MISEPEYLTTSVGTKIGVAVFAKSRIRSARSSGRYSVLRSSLDNVKNSGDELR